LTQDIDMSEIGTQGLEILVENPDEIEPRRSGDMPGERLVSWVVGKVGPWRDYRNRTYNERWAEYWRLWRGVWSEKDKNRESERSRLISPALAQAIEMSVAEIEEAILSREVWFDIVDDIASEKKEEALRMRDQLREDLDKVDVKSKISEAVMVGAIYGTGILKLNVDVLPNQTLFRDIDGSLKSRTEDKVVVDLEALRPDQCIPDPAGSTIEEMLGFGIDYKDKPVHPVLEKIRQGIYLKSASPYLIGGTRDAHGDEADYEDRVTVNKTETDKIDILEYHGKVPLFLLEEATKGGEKSLVDQLLEEDFKSDGDEGPLVEAIVTIANDGILLRAMVNPFTMTDRSIVAFPWEIVPGRFWGRGVAEKGYHPQKALDAEMRARTDALGFLSAPMLGLDSGRIPRGFKPEVKPGKIWLTQGPPNEVLQPVQIGALEPNTFNHTGELMQMVQMGTGAFDTASAIRGTTSSGGNAANSGSMLLGAFVKRSKRAIQNVDRKLVSPMIRKAALRYLQFAPSRYPFDDTQFVVKASLGIVAREIEQLNLTQLIAMLPEEAAQSKLAAAQGFIEMSSAINKADILNALKADQEQAASAAKQAQEQQQKLAELEQQIKQLELEAITLDNQLTIAKIRLTLADAEVNERKADQSEVQVMLEGQKVQINREELEAFERQNEISMKRLDLQEKALELREKQVNSGKAG
jgi:hypothetical protein